jgi:hypothetical protein
MTTKPLVQHLDVVFTSSDDLPALNRLLAAAAINSRFRAALLADPETALHTGFGGELFSFSNSTYKILASIRAYDLSDFIQKLNEANLLA